MSTRVSGYHTDLWHVADFDSSIAIEQLSVGLILTIVVMLNCHVDFRNLAPIL